MEYKQTSYGAGDEIIEVLILDEPMNGTLVGMISSPMFSENVALALDSRVAKGEEVDYDLACMGAAKDGSIPRIYLFPDLVLDLKAGSIEALFILFHELGHYVNGDLSGDYCSEDYDTQRVECVKDGKVSAKELAADAFAAKYIGRDKAIIGLEALLKRTQHSWNIEEFDEESVKTAIKEIEMRINLL